MADYWPAANGNWSTLSNWLTATGQTAGVLPTSADDVYADNRTVTVDISPRVNTVRSTAVPGGTAGGTFTLNNGISLSANVICGTGNCVLYGGASPNSASIIGNIFGGSGANPSTGAVNNSTGTLFIFGNAVGGSAATNGHGLNNNSSGTLTITGSITGGSSGGGSLGILNGSTGIVNVIGNCTGGTAVGARGITNNSTGTVNISGSVFGGIAGTGVANNSTGLIYATRVVGNSFGLGSVGIASVQALENTQNGRAYVEQVEFGSRGATPISGPVYILPSNRNTLTGRLTALGDTVTFYNSLSVSDLLPPVSSVQAGVVYNVGNSVGTMAVPSASAVQFGVPVDNTVGTAALQPQDVWGYARLSATQVDSMGDRLRNTVTTQSIGYQIASFNL